MPPPRLRAARRLRRCGEARRHAVIGGQQSISVPIGQVLLNDDTTHCLWPPFHGLSSMSSHMHELPRGSCERQMTASLCMSMSLWLLPPLSHYASRSVGGIAEPRSHRKRGPPHVSLIIPGKLLRRRPVTYIGKMHSSRYRGTGAQEAGEAGNNLRLPIQVSRFNTPRGTCRYKPPSQCQSSAEPWKGSNGSSETTDTEVSWSHVRCH